MSMTLREDRAQDFCTAIPSVEEQTHDAEGGMNMHSGTNTWSSSTQCQSVTEAVQNVVFEFYICPECSRRDSSDVRLKDLNYIAEDRSRVERQKLLPEN